jgi:hypothetical protein
MLTSFRRRPTILQKTRRRSRKVRRENVAATMNVTAAGRAAKLYRQPMRDGIGAHECDNDPVSVPAQIY